MQSPSAVSMERQAPAEGDAALTCTESPALAETLLPVARGGPREGEHT